MSTLYPQNSELMQRQLQVQEVVCQLGDGITTASTSVVTVTIGQPVRSVVNAIFVDDSAGTSAPIRSINRVINSTNGGSVVLTASAAVEAADSIVLRFIVD